MNRKTKRPKVVMFSTVHRATDGRIFHKEARSLAWAGCDVVVIASHHREEVVDGVHIKPLRAPSSRFRRILFSTSILPRMLREHADIYHFHDPELIFSGLLLRLLGKKAIYDSHEDLPKDILGKPYLPRWLRSVLSTVINPLEKCAARRMSGVVTATDSMLKRFAAATVLHNYPILSYVRQACRPTRRPAAEAPFVIYCGTISRILGASEMVEAVRLVSRHHPMKLRLLGPFQHEGLRMEVLHSGGASAVDYRGYTPMQEAYQNYAGALAGFVLYHPYPNHIEAMPNKIFESMACGVPLIASDFPLWRKIIHDQGCGLVVDPLNVPQIADAIIYLLDHPEEAKKMGRRGRELVERKYNWQPEAERLFRLYDKLLEKGQTEKRVRCFSRAPGARDRTPGGEVDYFAMDLSMARQVAELHAVCFREFFLTGLGERVLALYYRHCLGRADGICFVARSRSGRVVGFVAGSRDYADFIRSFYRAHFAPLAIAVVRGFLVSRDLRGKMWQRTPQIKAAIQSAFRGARFAQTSEAAGAPLAPGTAVLASVGVHPGFRGTGVALELLRLFEDRARELRALRAELSVLRSNGRAIAFYRKAGWRAAGYEAGNVIFEKML